MKLATGNNIGPYEILAPIGAGGMGEIYKAHDPQLDRDAAVKILPEHISSQSDALARLENEARLASSLSHPNIVTIYSMGWEGQCRYIAMEYIDGPTLQDLIDKGPLPVERALPIAAQIADGLAKAHEAGVIHRDLKPRNVMLNRDGIAKILDFGLSKLAVSLVDREEPTPTYMDGADGLTRPGTILGTVEYMSPEQAAGNAVDFRSDQFSLGSLIYATLTGQKPFHRETPIQTLNHIIEGEPQPITEINPRVPQGLESIVRRCMMKAPQERYASTRDLAHDLRELDLARQIPARHWTRRDWIRASLGLGLPFAAGGGLWVWLRRPYRPEPDAVVWYQKGLSALHSMTFDAARKAFEQAVAADHKFALAHASLAIAFDLLDYSERAKESMLHAMAAAQETRLSGAERTRLRALQAVVSKEFDQAAPLLQQLETAAGGRDKAAAALESGWLAEKRDDTEGAVAAYERALRSNLAFAAAKLRMGLMQHRQGEDEAALKSFSEAEALYNAASDLEGVTETLYQRANHLIRRSRAADAIPIIEKALSKAHAVDSRYQELRLQLLQSTAARNLGQYARARELAEKAIEAAVSEKMDNLATSGMVNLGNTLRNAGEFESAENYYRRALDVAQRGKVLKYEALASISLGALYEQRNHPEEARRFVTASLSFYRAAGYRRELVQAMAILGGALHQLGEFDQGIKALREALSGAIKLHDVGTEIKIRERLIEILQDQGAWTEALRESERTASLPGDGTQTTYARLMCAGLYWRLGRKAEAQQSLSSVEELLHKADNPQCLSMLRLRDAELSYVDGHFKKAIACARMAISALPSAGDQAEVGAKLIEALALIRGGSRNEGIQSALNLIRELDRSKLIVAAASARLSTAEALAAARERTLAQSLAPAALNFFEQRRIWESAWRGHMVSAQIAENSAEADTHKASALSILAQLRKTWSARDVERYLERADIKALCSAIQLR